MRGSVLDSSHKHSRIESIDIEAQQSVQLAWGISSPSPLLFGSSDSCLLNHLRNSILLLRQDYFSPSTPNTHLPAQNKQDIYRRLLLLQHELQGLLRRDIIYRNKNVSDGRGLDYTTLLNEKQNQIVELEKKVQNLEERLRRATSNVAELENGYGKVLEEMKMMREFVRSKNESLLKEVADKVRVKEIDFSRVNYEGWGDGMLKTKANIIGLFRELQREIKNHDTTQDRIDNIFQNFLMGFQNSRLQPTLTSTLESNKLSSELQTLKQKLSLLTCTWLSTINKLKQGQPVDFDTDLTPLLLSPNITISSQKDIIQIQRFTEKIIQIPTQDPKTKKLLTIIATTMKKMVHKFPQLKGEIDHRLAEFFSQELIDVYEVDGFERMVDMVKYVPQIVKVENVYAYSCEKSRRVEFHLRVLVKALLEELEAVRERTGAVLSIDEGVVGMIRQEIMGVVNLDDILKVFRVVPKIVEVEKVVEKVVERVVEVPQVIPIQKIVEKIIEVPKIQEIQRVVHVPVEVIKLVDNIVEKIVQVERVIERIVEVPKILEKIVERVVEVPKIVEIEKIVEKIVTQVEYQIVEKIIEKMIPEIQTVEIVVERIVPMEKVMQKIVEVPIYIQKIIEKPVEVIKVVEIQKVIQKLVKEVDHLILKEAVLEVIPEYKQIQRVVQNIIVVQKIVERIIQVPQIIQKIVQVTNEITIIKQIPTIVQKIIPITQIKQIEIAIPQVISIIQQVQKIIQKRIQIPIIHQKILKVPEIIQRIVIQRTEIPKIIEVQKVVQKIITQNKLIEIQKPIIHYIKDTQIVKSVVEKIVEVPRTIEVIKEVRVNIDRLIEKMVEIPKVVEVEKIVEKVVVVPRVIEKIVEVPQVVEKIVERIIEIEIVKEVQKVVHVPIITEKVVEVEVIKNVYVEVEKVVERVVEKIVPVEKIVERVIHITNGIEKIIQINNEVPKILQVEKIVPAILQTQKLVEIIQHTTLPIEIPVEVERIVEKVITVDKIIQKIIQVPQIIEKIIQVHTDNTIVKQIQKVVQKVVIQPEIKQIITSQIVIQDRWNEIPTIKQKIVTITNTVKQIVEVQRVLEKVIEKFVEIPKIVEIVKNVDKIVEVFKVVQLETIVPYIVKVNQIVEVIIQKIISIPLIQQLVKQVPTIQQKIIQVSTNSTLIKQIQTVRDKIIQVPKIVEIHQMNNVTDTTVQVVERFEERQVPVYSTVEKFVEVPYVLEKIFERVVVLPQVVEVGKYVHEIEEGNNLVAVGVDVSIQEEKYQEIYGVLRNKFDVLLEELRKLRVIQPNLTNLIVTIEQFLAKFNELASVQRIVRVDHQRLVQKQVPKPILVPTIDSTHLSSKLAKSLLIQQLINEIKRIKTQNPSIKLKLSQDIRLIFLLQMDPTHQLDLEGSFQDNLKSYVREVMRKCATLDGNWVSDYRLIVNTVLEEKFVMGNLIKQSNLEIEKIKAIADGRLEQLRKSRVKLQQFQSVIQQLKSTILEQQNIGDYSLDFRKISQILNRALSVSSVYKNQPTVYLGQIHGDTESNIRLQSLLRQSDYTISALKQKIVVLQKSNSSKPSDQKTQTNTIELLRSQNTKLTQQLTNLKQHPPQQKSQQQNLNKTNIEIRKLQAKNRQLQSQIRTTRLHYDNTIRLLKAENEDLNRQLLSFSLRDSQGVLKSGMLESQSIRSSYQSHPTSYQPQNILSTSRDYQATPLKPQGIDHSFVVNQSPQQISESSSKRLRHQDQSHSNSKSLNSFENYRGQSISYGNNITRSINLETIPVGSSISGDSLLQSGSYGLGSSVQTNRIGNSVSSNITARFGATGVHGSTQ